jgi:F-type H+-transporting ATPase subunit gamma
MGGIGFDELTAFPHPEEVQPEYEFPPLLQLPPVRFLAGLLEHHLFALLTHIFYTSLMVENRHRLALMERATRRIEGKTEELTLTRNILRQEESTQEIEIILLNVEDSGLPAFAHAKPGKGAGRW